MSGTTVELDSLRAAKVALERYVQSVRESVQNLNRNAEDCKDNMSNDVLSTKAAMILQQELVKINNALNSADAISVGLQRKIQDIEATQQIF